MNKISNRKPIRKKQTTKRRTRRRTTAKRSRKRRASIFRINGRVITFILLWLIIAVVVLFFKTSVFNLIFQSIRSQPSSGDYAGQLIQESIDLHHSITENPNNKARLLEQLTDPVAWYGFQRIPQSDLKFGSPYDRFGFINPLQFDATGFRMNNYEVRFDGMYRYRLPTDSLLAFESGLVVIEDGKIAMLRPYKNPNGYRHDWVNKFYRWFPGAAVGLGFIVTLILLNISQLPDDFRKWVLLLVKRMLGMG